MGHTRLGTIPKTRKWKEIVGALAGDTDDEEATPVADDVAEVAARALDAAQAGLDAAVNDPTLRFTFYLLTQIVLAAHEDDWQSRLTPFGIQLPNDATLFDLNSGFQTAIDEYRFQNGSPSDIGEMAQRAAGDAIVALD